MGFGEISCFIRFLMFYFLRLMRFFVDREKKKRVIREKPKLLKFTKKALKNGGIINLSSIFISTTNFGKRYRITSN
jgi:hypothetical protein